MPAARYSPSVIPSAGVGRGVESLAYSNPLEDALSAVSSFGQKAAVSGAADEANAAVLSGENVTPKLGLTPAGQAYNEAAQRATIARTSMDFRAKAAELGAQFTGQRPGDSAAYEKIMGAHVDQVVQTIDPRWRGEAKLEGEFRLRTGAAAIAENENRTQFKTHVDDIQAGIVADVQETARIARDGGSEEVLAALHARAANNYAELVNLGALGPQAAAAALAEDNSAIHAEAIFGAATRTGNGTSVIHALESGDKRFADLTLKQRDTLVNKITGELSRQHAESVRADADQERAGKNDRDLAATKLFMDIYSGDASRRPTADTIYNAQAAGVIDGGKARQAIETLATNKIARNDSTTILNIERGIVDGVDTSDQISEGVQAGTISEVDAGDLFARNSESLTAGIPKPVRAARDGLVDAFREHGPLSTVQLDSHEAERTNDALAFFDQQVRNAPDGNDPATGLPLRQIVAEQTAALLTERHKLAQSKNLQKVPPRNAVFDKVGLLKIGRTYTQLRIEHEDGILSDDAYRAELRIIGRWKSAGLGVE